jgi:hypothetical protein
MKIKKKNQCLCSAIRKVWDNDKDNCWNEIKGEE